MEWGSVLLLARDEVEEGQTSEQKVKGQRKTLQLLRSLSRHLPSRVERTETHTHAHTHTRRERETFFSKSQILTGFLVGASSVSLDSFKIRQFIKVTNDLEFSDKGEKNKVRT